MFKYESEISSSTFDTSALSSFEEREITPARLLAQSDYFVRMQCVFPSPLNGERDQG